MADLLSAAVVIAIMILLAMTVAALLHVLNGGVRQTDEYLRGGVSLGSLWRGTVRKQDTGSLVTVREGLRASVNEDGEVEMRGTRTIARDAL
ncbi:hypothetical protein [Sphingomonas hengshuiensis]|uniref:Uncharacterized protein n=1 Tax=Sphingomonas hengshuiensis TaxID=1609977 RepID=A0A7U4JAV1_9SPHN|nr:hypothetical protein [Sphingomonas hengshuiensis]AJP73429.1 hypothetical protein TS85_19020 [Sphingomonas hengshuiensis]